MLFLFIACIVTALICLTWWYPRPHIHRVLINAKSVKPTFYKLLRENKHAREHELYFIFQVDESPENRACVIQASRAMIQRTASARVLNPSQSLDNITPHSGCVSMLIRDIVLAYISPQYNSSAVIDYYPTSAKREREVFQAYSHERTFRVSNATSCVHATILKYMFPSMKINLRSQDERIRNFYQTFLA